MENIEKLLEAFATGLFVRHEPVASDGEGGKEKKVNSEAYYTVADDETKERFKDALSAHLLKRLNRCAIGRSVTYNYYLGTVRTAPSFTNTEVSVASANTNLQEVLDELPKLSDGEFYAFPAQTAVSVKVVGFTQDDITTRFEGVSSWLKEAMQ